MESTGFKKLCFMNNYGPLCDMSTTLSVGLLPFIGPPYLPVWPEELNEMVYRPQSPSFPENSLHPFPWKMLKPKYYT